MMVHLCIFLVQSLAISVSVATWHPGSWGVLVVTGVTGSRIFARPDHNRLSSSHQGLYMFVSSWCCPHAVTSRFLFQLPPDIQVIGECWWLLALLGANFSPTLTTI